jgi:hypothetical protein
LAIISLVLTVLVFFVNQAIFVVVVTLRQLAHPVLSLIILEVPLAHHVVLVITLVFLEVPLAHHVVLVNTLFLTGDLHAHHAVLVITRKVGQLNVFHVNLVIIILPLLKVVVSPVHRGCILRQGQLLVLPAAPLEPMQTIRHGLVFHVPLVNIPVEVPLIIVLIVQ